MKALVPGKLYRARGHGGEWIALWDATGNDRNFVAALTTEDFFIFETFEDELGWLWYHVVCMGGIGWVRCLEPYVEVTGLDLNKKPSKLEGPT